MIRHLIKRSAEVGIVRTGLCRVWRQAVGERPMVVAYHNIVPDDFTGPGDPALHLPQETFARQMEVLCRTHEIVSLEEWLGAVQQPGRGRGDGRPLAAITFDDAYRGAIALGGEVLRAFDLPATFFVSPALLGSPSFWWDALSDPTAGLDEGVRAHALNRCRGCQDEVLVLARERGLEVRALPPAQRPGTLEQLDSLATERPEITVASHSWTHCNLTRLTDSRLEDELARPVRWLSSRDWRVGPWLAYPYGLSSSRVEDAARRIGYRACFRVSGGGYEPRSHARLSLPRLNVPSGVSPEGFELRVSDVPWL